MALKTMAIQLLIIILLSFSMFAASMAQVPHMPDSIKAINNPVELASYLESSNPLEKWWGVRRMGEIGSGENIPQLIAIYEDTPFEPGVIMYDRGRDIKDMVLLAIGEIGGPQAESVVFNIIDDLDIHNIKALDSLDIITYSCYAFAEMSSFNAIRWLNSIYKDTLLSYSYRATALEAIYLTVLSMPKYSSAKDTVEFLLDKLSRNFSFNIQQIENYIISEAVARTFHNISYPEIYNELSLQSEYLSEDIKQNWHFRYLKSGVKIVSDSPIKLKWRWAY